MVIFNNTQRSFIPTAPKPEVDGVLPDVPGGQMGLLPVALTGDDLKVWFTIPTYSDPTAKQEKYELFADDDTDAIDTRYWNTPISDSDRYLTLSRNWLRNNDGAHRIYYKTTIYNDAEDYSFDLLITLDTAAPVLATDSKPNFPSAVLPPQKLSARYLEQNGDQVEAGLPAYMTPGAWDRIEWFWGSGPGDLNPGGAVELDDQNFTKPLVIMISGQLIRDRGDGRRFAQYRVTDRAGNVSTYSAHVELDVDATPIPRTLPWPSIEDAAGTGEQQTFDPLNGTSGAVMVIPTTAVIYPDDEVGVQWADPESLGAHRSLVPITPGGRRYQIPMRSIAAFMGQSLPVYYFVIETGGGELASEKRQLKVGTLPVNRFPTVQCQGLSGGNLSYANIPATGAALTLGTWSLMTIDQHIKFRMTGVAQSGVEAHYDVPPRAVTTAELSGGIRGVTVPKAFFNTLQRNRALTGKVYVSFDGGKTWPLLVAPNFPLLQLTLVA